MSIVTGPARIGIAAAESGIVPDALVRLAIRRLCAQRLRDCERRLKRESGQPPFLSALTTGPIALVPDLANDQHYELPPEFFEIVLGPHRKYSCCLFQTDDATLAEAEAASLEATCAHARITDGQSILELGCGWGSLTLWIAERYPRSSITAVSNSSSQRRWIESQAAARGLTNLKVITADINEFSPGQQSFDRVVSVEMFEHVRNYDALLQRISGWLRPDGLLFVHVFCHREHLYPFEEAGATDWMATNFFSGGLMPSLDLFHHFSHRMALEAQWVWNGVNYQRTADAWLANLDGRRADALDILKQRYGSREASVWLQRWRMFFMAVSELFGYAAGNEWQVTHCRLKPVR